MLGGLTPFEYVTGLRTRRLTIVMLVRQLRVKTQKNPWGNNTRSTIEFIIVP